MKHKRSPILRPTRRELLALGGAGAAGLLAGGPRLARAAGTASRSDLKFVFVRVFGGWDPTMVFAPLYDTDGIDVDPNGYLGKVGDLQFTDSDERPSVRSYLESWTDRIAFVNGLVVPSLNHRICEQLAFTGSSAQTAPDWPTLIAADQADTYSLPHVVISGQPMVGDLGTLVARIGDNGQVERLVSGSILEESDQEVSSPTADAEAVLDRYVLDEARARAAIAAHEREQTLTEAWVSAVERSQTIKDLSDEIDWGTDGSFESQVDLAADLLALGISRCVTVAFVRGTWDSHEGNDKKQSENFEELFAGLRYLQESLESRSGPTQGKLSDEVVVVVMSEMGRTPQYNISQGKDHWTQTSAMVVGPGITGNRVVGGYTDLFYGATLDLETAEISESGRELTPELWGATLLALADVDPGTRLSENSPISGMLT